MKNKNKKPHERFSITFTTSDGHNLTFAVWGKKFLYLSHRSAILTKYPSFNDAMKHAMQTIANPRRDSAITLGPEQSLFAEHSSWLWSKNPNLRRAYTSRTSRI